MKDIQTKFAWFPLVTDKGVRWLETVGVYTTKEERELYPWYPGCFESPTFEATVENYVCLRGDK